MIAATDTTAPSQTETISFEFELAHAPEKVWQSGFRADQKRESGGARYGWKMMGAKLGELLGRMS